MKRICLTLVLLLACLLLIVRADTEPTPTADKESDKAQRAAFLLERVCELIYVLYSEPNEWLLYGISHMQAQVTTGALLGSLLDLKTEFSVELEESNPLKDKADQALALIKGIEPSVEEWFTAFETAHHQIYTGELASDHSASAFKLAPEDYYRKLVALSTSKLAQRRLELEQMIPHVLNGTDIAHEDVAAALRACIESFKASSARYEPLLSLNLSVGDNINVTLVLIGIFAAYLSRETKTTFDDCSREDFIVIFEAYLAKPKASFETGPASPSASRGVTA